MFNLNKIMARKLDYNNYEKKDNCLKLKKRLSFGIEIEFQLENKNLIKSIGEELVRCGYTTTAGLRRYDEKGNGNEWVLKKEATCDFEISSPVFYDTKDSWEQIERVCDILSGFGGYTDEHCALHIHIGVEHFLNDGNMWAELFKAYQQCEPFIVRFSGDSFNPISNIRLEKYALCTNTLIYHAWHKWDGLDKYLKKIKNSSDIDLCKGMFLTRNVGMNWKCLVEEEKTIEFRTFNGTLIPSSIQEYIFIVCRLVDCVNEHRYVDADVDTVLLFRRMNDEYIDKILNYLFRERKLRRRFRKSLEQKPELDEFVWDMLKGIWAPDINTLSC